MHARCGGRLLVLLEQLPCVPQRAQRGKWDRASRIEIACTPDKADPERAPSVVRLNGRNVGDLKITISFGDGIESCAEDARKLVDLELLIPGRLGLAPGDYSLPNTRTLQQALETWLRF